MPKRGPRDPDRKLKATAREALNLAPTEAEFNAIWDLSKERLGLDKLDKVVKNQEELNQRKDKKAKVEDLKQEVKDETPEKEELSNTTANSSSSKSCNNTELQAQLSKCSDLGKYQ